MNNNSSSFLFGYETKWQDCALALVPVPWEVTVSYGAGSSCGPSAILQASPQLDLYTYDKSFSIEKHPIYFCPENPELKEKNNLNKKKAQKIIKYLESHCQLDPENQKLLTDVNQACENMVSFIYNECQAHLAKEKKVAIVGGDHSSPLGLIKALSENYENYDVLHIDAHLDLRKSYQGFKHSHASIMYNVLQLENRPENLVSVGIRDYCQEEMELVESQNGVCSFTDHFIQQQKLSGTPWLKICDQILNQLKNPTYISFDIDGLDPVLCPNTGTPVPGGLNFSEAQFLLEKLSQHQKVIGFDLCEVSPNLQTKDEWDGNVGSRILFLLYKTLFPNP